MKIKRKTFWGGIIATLGMCAALTFGAVFSASNNNMVSAEAAVNQPTISFGTIKYASGAMNVSCDYSSMSTSIAGLSASASGGGSGSFTFTISTANIGFVAAAAPVILEITVPAYTVYTIKYDTAFSYGNSNSGKTNCFYDQWSAIEPTSFPLYTWKYISPSGITDWVGKYHADSVDYVIGQHPQGHGLVLENNTATDKQITRYAFYSAHADSANLPNDQVFAISNFKVTAAKIAAPTTTDTAAKTYDGTDKTFSFKYDTPKITDYDSNITYSYAYNNIETTVDAVDGKSNQISASTYDLSAAAVNRTLTAKEAGTYTVKFKLKQSAITGGIAWSDGSTTAEKTLTFKIDPKQIDKPEDLETTYNGDKQLLSTLAAGKSWYDNTIYSDSNILNVSKSDFTDANESGYSVTAEIVSPDYEWANSATDSSATRSFKVKVKKKKLTVSFETNSGLKVAKFADENEIYTRDKNDADKNPVLTTKYSQSGTLSDPSTGKNAPDSTGNWYAYAVLTTDPTKCNYYVDAKQQFSVDKTAVPYPTLNGTGSKEYDGTKQTFTFTGFDSTKMKAPDLPAGAVSFDGTTLEVKNVGSYTPVFALKDTDFYAWQGTAPAAVKITPKPVTLLADGVNPVEWEYKTEKELKFKVKESLCTGDTTFKFTASFTKDGGVVTSVSSGNVTVNGTSCTVKIDKNFEKGNYVLTLKAADGENYSGSITHNFKITAQGLTLPAGDVKWNIAGKTFVTTDYENNGVFEMEYTGTPLSLTNVTVDFSSADDAINLEPDGDITGDFVGAKGVGEYTATFKIKAKGEYACSDGPFTLKIKIVPKKLDFANAEWEYSSDGGTTWSKITASDKPSYNDGNPINVRISPDYLSGLGLADGDYTINYTQLNDTTQQGNKTTKATVTLSSSNFEASDGSNSFEVSFNWEITAKALNYTWDGKQVVTVQTAGGEKTFELPAIKFADGGDHTQHYDYVYKVDGDGATEYTLDELKNYIASHWTETTPVTGTVNVKMKDGVTDVNIKPGSRSFTTGTPKTALEVEISGGGAEFGKTDFALKVAKGTSDERARTSVSVTGGLLASAMTFDGNSDELTAFMNGLGVGKYTVVVSLKAGQETSYVLTKTDFEFEVKVRKVVVPQLKDEITFNGGYINIADHLDENYNADIMSLVSGYTNKNAGAYTVTFKLASSNYEWVEPTSAETNSKKLFGKAVLFVDGISIDNSALTATLDWRINKIVLGTGGWNFGKKEEGVSLNALADYQKMIEDNQLDIAIAYRYYDTNGNLIEEPVLKDGDKYLVEAFLTGADAANFEFEDGTDAAKSVSAQQEYNVPQSGAAKFFGSTLNFLKANWLWFVIGAAVLLFLIILICIIASAKKKKKRRLAEEKAERERKEEREREERRLEREERMARTNQQQSMPQMMMPQMLPSMMPQMQMPQQQPQPMSQTVQPVTAGGGSMDGSQFAMIQAELAAIKAEQSAAKELAAMRAEQSAAKELAELKAKQTAKETAEQQVIQAKNEMQFANMANRMGGEQVGGISVDTMTEIMTAALKNVLATATQQAVTAQPAQPAQLTDGTNANAGQSAPVAAQVPPDAVMTTVTTTKIDTTKKAQNGQGNAQATRQTRSFVPPMPVDDGRVFDVGGFYKPADPVDLVDDDVDNK